jgi:hypothetical protein
MTRAEIDAAIARHALRTEIDESAWSALYTTTSRGFPKPKTTR